MKKLRNNARGYILDMFAQHHMVKRTVLSFLSIVIMGFGTALFNVSGFGVDPFTSMNMSVAAVLGVSFGTYQLIINAVILLYVVIVAHRGLVGVGTVFNMAGVGYSCELFSSLLMPMVKQNDTLIRRIMPPHVPNSISPTPMIWFATTPPVWISARKRKTGSAASSSFMPCRIPKN